MSKPFKGIISDWTFVQGQGLTGRISGTCVVHTTYDNGIEVGQNITTSPIVNIISRNGRVWAETKNSQYLLV